VHDKPHKIWQALTLINPNDDKTKCHRQAKATSLLDS